ncbi:MAG: tRNA (adenosine(37)-N6)-threonylcarbamoyltransferase complex transferase subunit TsaD [Chthoniobacteraceae bacterium]
MTSDPITLAIETSCDETAVAVLRGRTIVASEVASQIDLHALTGGVVPEVAARDHLRKIRPVLERTLAEAGVTVRDVDAYAATRGPGLATSLMIGTSIAKGLALASGRPFVGVNHLEGHLLSPFYGGFVKPAVGLVVSGGHTLLVNIEGVGRYKPIGGTVDDAAGEAFDKVGKLLGLPYPGGPHVNRLAADGDAARYDFPRSMMDSGDYSFSFSGLKTSVRYLLPKLKEYRVADLCASFQEAVVDVLVAKTLKAVADTGRGCIAISGGVSANTRLRERFESECAAVGVECLFAAPELCTDNAAMIGYVAALKLARAEISPMSTDIDPNLRLV